MMNSLLTSIFGKHSEEVNAGWELVERHVQMKDWVAAARILTRCVRIVEQEEVKQIGAIYDIRIALTDLYSV